MSLFKNVFNAFSRRENPNIGSLKPLPLSFRNRFLMILFESTQSDYQYFSHHLGKKLAFLYGDFPKIIRNKRGDADWGETIRQFILTCENEKLIDSIEFLFQLPDFNFKVNENEFISSINLIFKADDLPYFLTSSIWEEYIEDHGRFKGKKLSKQVQYPKIIRKDSEVLHNLAVEPALILLRAPELKFVNEEYLEALEDYRKGKYRDSVTKSCSAFESIMKVILDKKRINHDPEWAAGKLVTAIRENSTLDPFWEQPLLLIATIRSRIGSAHGAGTTAKEVPEHIALYSLNATAAAMLMLWEEFS